MIELSGPEFFQYRLVLSTFSGKPVKICGIRPNDENPGLRDYEILFLRFLEALTNGSTIEINYTGTEVIYHPGSILGGSLEFDCGVERGISYFLEPILLLAPFSKLAFKLKLTGLTSHAEDTSIDIIRTVYLKVLGYYGVAEGLDLKIAKRGSPPLGGGEVDFVCPVLASLKNADLSDPGRIKRIRGIASVTRISPQASNRLVEGCRSVLNQFIPDIYIYSDVFKGPEAGLSPGFGINLVAESTSGALVHSDLIGGAGSTPEEISRKASKKLLAEIAGGGYVSQCAHSFVIIIMAMTTDNVNKVCLRSLSESDNHAISLVKTFLGISYKIKRMGETDSRMVLSCLGSGYVNFNQRNMEWPIPCVSASDESSIKWLEEFLGPKDHNTEQLDANVKLTKFVAELDEFVYLGYGPGSIANPKL